MKLTDIFNENLRNWFKKEKWVRIGSDGSIQGACGKKKAQKNPARCLPYAKAKSLSKAERAKTARRKKRGGKKGKQFVKNTKKSKVKKEIKMRNLLEIKEVIQEMLYEMSGAYESHCMEEDMYEGGCMEEDMYYEGKKKKKADRCKRKADSVYGKKTSAYKSGAIVKCRKGMIWKKGSKKKK